MPEEQNPKPYNLGDRTLKFAKRVRSYVKDIPKTLAGIEDTKQQAPEGKKLTQEAIELIRIFGAIVEKSK